MTHELVVRLLAWNAQMITLQELAVVAQLCRDTHHVVVHDHLLRRYYGCHVLIRKLLLTRVLNNAWHAFTTTDFTPMFVTREYSEDDWTAVAYPFFGTLTSEQWAVYYAFWYQYAQIASTGATCRVTDNGELVRRVSMKLFGSGWLQQLPNSNGNLTFQWGEDALLLSVVSHNGDIVDVQVQRGSVGCEEKKELPYPCDWCLFRRAVVPMRRLQTSHGCTDAELSKLVYSIL
jgi:hypothetical protein